MTYFNSSPDLQLLTIEQACERLRARLPMMPWSKHVLYRAHRAGQLQTLLIRHRRYVREADLEDYMCRLVQAS